MDVGRYYEQKLRQQDGLVRDFMSYDIVTVSPELDLERAAKLMNDHGVGNLPVVREGRVVGIITVDDIRAWKEKTTGK